MSNDEIGTAEAVTAILVMGMVTYLTRVSGVWLVALVPSTARIERFLHHLSGCILAALTVTSTFGGTARASGVAGAIVLMLVTRNVLVSLISATILAAIARAGGW